jgi:orotate phosphoribosyltransferase
MNIRKLAKRVYQTSNIHGLFTLRSGQTSTEYFDKYLFESNPFILNEISRKLKRLIPQNVDFLGGLEMGGIPLATIISHHSNIPALFIRKNPKEYGTCKYVEGGLVNGKNILLIEDVVTSGGAILDAVTKLRNDNAIISKVLCVIDRESGGKEKLKENSLELHALFTKSELEYYGKAII